MLSVHGADQLMEPAPRGALLILDKFHSFRKDLRWREVISALDNVDSVDWGVKFNQNREQSMRGVEAILPRVSPVGFGGGEER